MGDTQQQAGTASWRDVLAGCQRLRDLARALRADGSPELAEGAREIEEACDYFEGRSNN